MKHNMGEIIAERRKALGMTQFELSNKLNIKIIVIFFDIIGFKAIP